jgi:ATP-dependent Clp protease ATP-binding subunit ClpA
MEELKQYFRPEFLNRLDEIIVFRQLTKSEVKSIADIMLKGVVDRAKEKEITIDLTEKCAPALSSIGRAMLACALHDVSSGCGGASC